MVRRGKIAVAEERAEVLRTAGIGHQRRAPVPLQQRQRVGQPVEMRKADIVVQHQQEIGRHGAEVRIVPAAEAEIGAAGEHRHVQLRVEFARLLDQFRDLDEGHARMVVADRDLHRDARGDGEPRQPAGEIRTTGG